MQGAAAIIQSSTKGDISMIFKFATNSASILSPPEGCEIFGMLYETACDEHPVAEVLCDLETGELFPDTFWGPAIDEEAYVKAAERVIAAVLCDVFGRSWRRKLPERGLTAVANHVEARSDNHARDSLLKSARAMVLSGLPSETLKQALLANEPPGDLDPSIAEQVQIAWSALRASGQAAIAD